MSTPSNLWRKLAKSRYREELVAAQLKRRIPFQVRCAKAANGHKRSWLHTPILRRALFPVRKIPTTAT